jgi:uncharacterized YccA/Bax inhibitor family protein
MTMETWSDVQKLLALGIVLAFVGVIVLLIFHPLQDPAANTILPLVGALGGMAGGVVTYYFGSSKGSTDKDTARDSTMNTLVDKVTGTGNGAAPK